MDKCSICQWKNNGDVLCGEWLTSGDIKVHYFCLLSCTTLPQNGFQKKSVSGIMGFLVKDIVQSFPTYRETQCYLCAKLSAPIKCAYKGCGRSYHYTCGTRNSCMTVFRGIFESYCGKHVPDYNDGKKPPNNELCSVCLSPFGSYHPADCIITSCCLKLDDWFKCFVHKGCALKYTLNAGYDAICINCTMEDGLTKEKWQEEMRKRGVFVPMRPASWEQDGRFENQVKNKCGDKKCKIQSCANVWTCFVCGCFPMHLKCAGVKSFEEYYCPKCYDQSFVNRVPKY